MSMIDIAPLLLAWAAGLGLGMLYFGGLWYTMRALPTTDWPVLLTLGSLVVRMTAVLLGFYFVATERWERLLACLFGFVVARLVVVAWLRPRQGVEN